MKLIDIAIKDMRRYFRSVLAIGFMLVIPLLITGLIYAAFGGVLTSSETDAYTLPVIRVQIANLDEGSAVGNLNLGQSLLDALTSEEVKDVFAVTVASSAESARGAVDQQQAALALIIPDNFTRAAVSGDESASVELYQDPTLSFGPGITKEITGQFLDALAGGRIASRAVVEQLAASGQASDEQVSAGVQAAYAEWFKKVAGSKEWNLPVTKRLPNRETPKSVSDHRTTLLGPVMAGMMIFFVFFTGANMAQTILKEQEEGTLARMFTTPTPMTSILGGKFAAIFVTLIVQAVVLTAASALAFQINWGNLPALALVLAGLVAASTGFGILLISFLKTDAQAGPVIGGVLAVTGMLSGLYTTAIEGANIFDQVGLVMPQGWALRGLKLVLTGATAPDVLLPAGVLLLFGVLFFSAGAWVSARRFA